MCYRRLHFLDMTVRFWTSKPYIHGSKGKVLSTDLSGSKLSLCKNDLAATGLSSAGLFRSNQAIHHWRQKSLPIFTSDMCPPAGRSLSWYRQVQVKVCAYKIENLTLVISHQSQFGATDHLTYFSSNFKALFRLWLFCQL